MLSVRMMRGKGALVKEDLGVGRCVKDALLCRCKSATTAAAAAASCDYVNQSGCVKDEVSTRPARDISVRVTRHD